ncbi:PepSY-associated TM helix domain-containing protein [Halomonas binhaiensis]|uniref:PepSY domain-containing protein n=1 Tax=Halomonas binhaiensis TaxID=2562282 RepID=A0A5C1NLQ7_9GAMM|nr:PepSY-associated TM helix domain-containing protein [Halomonas binhaiensis]QEM83085.1 PepSY domain-containing protein [Halomonas binhaiensis]
MHSAHSREAPPKASWAPALKALVIRLHFYVGLLVGPFIFFAALSGTLYALTPALEKMLYQHALSTGTVTSDVAPHSLAEQIGAAQQYLGHDVLPSAVRPAPEAGATTRVMFSDPKLKSGEHRAIFIDPTNLEVRGDLTVYGTSGVLPLRKTIDQLHRSLMLGDLGRLYSELAASWLWIAALGGLAIWWFSPKVPRQDSSKLSRSARRLRTRRRHSTLGLVLLVGLLGLSATGMTWSKWAGDNFFTLLKIGGWTTPRVSVELDASESASTDPHAGHHDHSVSHAGHAIPLDDFDHVLTQARSAGLDAGLIELIVPGEQQAWKVREIDRSWPSQVDEVTVHPSSFQVLEQVAFSDYPLMAKLTRWGVDAHMGVLFGRPNQLLLTALGIGIMTMVAWGYAMWWRRRPSVSQPLWHTLGRLPFPALLLTGIISLGLGYAMPVMGVSLLVFLLIDGVRSLASTRQATTA